jgi:hypothetical protein
VENTNLLILRCERVCASLEGRIGGSPRHSFTSSNAGIELSPLSWMPMKRLNSRVRGNERVGRFAFYRLGLKRVGHIAAGLNLRFLHALVRGDEHFEARALNAGRGDPGAGWADSGAFS